MKLIIQAFLLSCFLGPLLAQDRLEQLLKWNEANLRAVELTSPSPCLVARNFAIIQGAVFESYNGIHPAYESAFLGLPEAEEGMDAELAALAAAWHTSKSLFPSYRAVYDKLWGEQLETWDVSSERALSVDYGIRVADACLKARSDDGASGTITYIPKSEPGKWRRTAPRHRPPELPHWPLVRPFVIENAAQFRPPPPPPLISTAYAEAVAEVQELGRERAETTENDRTQQVAHFWSCFSYTATPSGHWNEIAAILMRKEGLGFGESARIFAVLNLTLADVGIATWECKYHYESWRPIDAIRMADKDGNSATVREKGWNSELESPPHPEYVSGHSAFSGAGARMLALLLGEDAISFTASSVSLPGVTIDYESLETCAEEIGMSRLYGGIHFRFSNRAGLDMGRAISDWVFPRIYQPIDG